MMTSHNNKDNDDYKRACHKEHDKWISKVLGFSSDSSGIDDNDEPSSKRMCFLDSTHDKMQGNIQ